MRAFKFVHRTQSPSQTGKTELDRIRTCDPRLKRAVLYLLSYQPDDGEKYRIRDLLLSRQPNGTRSAPRRLLLHRVCDFCP